MTWQKDPPQCHDWNWRKRKAAVETLSPKAADDRGAAIVRWLFEDSHYEVRKAAVEALGKSEEAVARHSAAIANKLEDSHWDVRKAAVVALGKSEEVVARHGATIANVLEDSHWGTRKAAVDALGRSPEAVAQHGSAITQRLLEDPDERVHKAAAEALGRSRVAVAAHGASIARRLDHSDWGVRKAAAETLGKSPETVAQHGAPIARRLADPDARVRSAAAEALGESTDAVAQHGAAIVRSLEDSEYCVRKAAVEALGKSREALAQHGAAISQRLEHSTKDARDAAVELLASSPEAVAQHGAAIAERLEHSDNNVRKSALDVLSTSREAVAKHGAAISRRITEDSDERVREAAVKALGEFLKAVVQCGAAISLLNDSDERVRSAAAEALGECSAAVAGEPLGDFFEVVARRCATLVKSLDDADSDVCKAAVQALRIFTPEHLAQFAPQVVQHVSRAKRDVAILACDALPFVNPEVLAKRLHQDKSAFRALGQLEEIADLLKRTVAADPTLGDLVEANDGKTYVDLAVLPCRNAMKEALYVLGCFDVDRGPPLHVSPTAVVFAATEHKPSSTTEDEVEREETLVETSNQRRLPRRAALKAMREMGQVLAELDGRKGIDSRYVVRVIGVYVDNNKQVDENENDEKNFEKLSDLASKIGVEVVAKADGLSIRIKAELERRSQSEKQFQRAEGYRYLLALELADCTLAETLSRGHVVADFPLTRHIASDLALALDHLHKMGRIHADFKPLNAVRIGSNWLLIDMDASRALGEPLGTKLPSTGYCPPEMAKVLLNAAARETGKVDATRLREYAANVAHDLWSFGCVLFLLVFGKPLLLVDFNDDVAIDLLEQLACVPDATALECMLEKQLHPGPSATDDLKAACVLLRELLEPDGAKRLKNFTKKGKSPMRVLLDDEPFFTGKDLDDATKEAFDDVNCKLGRIEARLEVVNERTTTVAGVQRAAITTMALHARNLRACIQAVASDTVPLAFVILFHSPVKELELNPNDESAASTLFAAYRDVEKMVTEPSAFFEATCKSKKKLFLSLVCEMCWMPQPDAYDATQHAESCRKVMPIAKATLGMIATLNVAASIAQCFYPGVRSISKSRLEAAKKAIGQFDAERSVVEFDAIQSKLEESDRDCERGALLQTKYCLRELMDLIEKLDPKHVWANLEHVLLLPDGESAWVCARCAAVLKNEKNKSYDELRRLCKPYAPVHVSLANHAPP
ncbi:hypothetical protein CTAYLR_008457 [Chrysophaeum taylorii]|uniref:Protein kinase domain-containing protein n=1 Tax=Chrysophaeum taylorii TaxID=2483200 RepID=A0AAD7UCV3_9STRA|nr:hypothetical protein CTAYLR_008457 [Chrysophaeum taylorii]